jgi:2-amino-4-hydroxy-6-hydroxymethyldihydropteridine diphosphokinase
LIRENPNIGPRVNSLRRVQDLVTGRTAYVFGAGPDLEEELDRALLDMEDRWKVYPRDDVLIAADGATSILMSRNILPDIIVTDLDGNVQDQISCVERGSIMFVHAHGDNLDAITDHIPALSGDVVGTTQTDPASGGNLDNFGGFSDGDRAAFLAQHFGAIRIVLLGFDFNEIGEKIGRGGERRALTPEEERRKFKKMAWAFALLGLITRPQIVSFSENYPMSMG